MKIQKFEEIIEKCDEKGIPNYTEIILGLPLETLDTWKKGINDLLEMVNIHQWIYGFVKF